MWPIEMKFTTFNKKHLLQFSLIGSFPVILMYISYTDEILLRKSRFIVNHGLYEKHAMNFPCPPNFLV